MALCGFSEEVRKASFNMLGITLVDIKGDLLDTSAACEAINFVAFFTSDAIINIIYTCTDSWQLVI